MVLYNYTAPSAIPGTTPTIYFLPFKINLVMPKPNADIIIDPITGNDKVYAFSDKERYDQLDFLEVSPFFLIFNTL